MKAQAGQAGFSLVELCFAATILLVMLGSLAGVQTGVSKLLKTTSAIGSIDEMAQRAIDKVSAEVKWAERTSLLLTTESGASRIDLRVPTNYVSNATVWSSTIIYKVEAGTVDANGDGLLNEKRLVRIQAGRKTVLCENVIPGGFTATRSSQNVTLELKLEKADSGRVYKNHASTSVSLRN